jgi:hypothetical protein
MLTILYEYNRPEIQILVWRTGSEGKCMGSAAMRKEMVRVVQKRSFLVLLFYLLAG